MAVFLAILNPFSDQQKSVWERAPPFHSRPYAGAVSRRFAKYLPVKGEVGVGGDLVLVRLPFGQSPQRTDGLA